jgi:hypothetical protein
LKKPPIVRTRRANGLVDADAIRIETVADDAS